MKSNHRPDAFVSSSESDSSDVRDALKVASSLWEMGMREDAVRWLRTAAAAAAQNGQRSRAAQIASLAAPHAGGGNSPAKAVARQAPVTVGRSQAVAAQAPQRAGDRQAQPVLESGMRPMAPPKARRHAASVPTPRGLHPSLARLQGLYVQTGSWAEETRDESTQLNIYAHLPFDRAEEQLRSDEHWLGLIELYLGRVECSSDPAQQIDLLLRIATTYEDRLAQPEQAMEALLTAYRLDGLRGSVAPKMEALAERADLWGLVLETVDSWLEAATLASEQVALALRLAEWYVDLGRSEFAVPLLSQAAVVEPENVKGMRLMARVHRRRGEWREAGRILEQALQTGAEPYELSRVTSELASLLERFPEHQARCCDLYREALELDGSNRTAIDAMEQLARRTANEQELADVLGKKAQQLAGAEGADAVLVEQAQLLEQLGCSSGAVAPYRAALEIAPNNLDAIVGLRAIFRRERAWAQLRDVLEMHIDVVASERERVALIIELAILMRGELGQPAEAARRLEGLLCVDPHNRDALVQLSECYDTLKRYRDRLDCLERLLELADSPTAKLDLLTAMAVCFESKLDDLVEARRMHQRMLAIDANSALALRGLARLAQEEGQEEEAKDYWGRLSRLETSDALRAEAFFHLATLAAEGTGDETVTRENYQRVLDLQPDHLDSLGALRRLAVREERWRAAVRLLWREQGLVHDPRQRAALLVQLGQIQAERFHAPADAVAMCQHALRLDPYNREALWRLARCHRELGDLREAAALAQRMCNEMSLSDNADEVLLFSADCHIDLGEFDAAYAKYSRVEGSQSDARAVRGMADSLFGMRRWSEAANCYQRAIKLLDMENAQLRARTLFRLGCSLVRSDKLKQAVQHLASAFELSPNRIEYVVYLCNVYRDLKAPQRGLAVAERALDSGLDPASKKIVLMWMGGTFWDLLKNAKDALACYRKALRLSPQDHALMHRMLPLHYHLADWQGLLATLKAIATLDDVPARRARYFYTIGQVHHLELDELKPAAEAFAEAVRLDAGYTEALSSLETVLVASGKSGEVVAHYRRAVEHALKQGNKLAAAELCQKLGLLYFEQLGDGDAAALAFRRALAFNPDLVETRGWLAELAAEAGKFSEALQHYRSILEVDAYDVDAYRSMYQIHRLCENIDGAYCCAAALVELGAATPEEAALVESLGSSGPAKISASLNEAVWAERVRHPRQSGGLARIFAAVSDAAYQVHIAAKEQAGQRPALDLNERIRSNSSLDIARALRWGAAILSVPIPAIYVRNSERGGLRAVVAEKMATVAGDQACRASATVQAYLVGEHLAGNRRDQVVGRLVEKNDHRALKVLLYAALRLGRAQIAVPVELAGDVALLLAQLNSAMSHSRREELRYAVKAFIREGGRASVKDWLVAHELTAARTGLLLCGRLDVALSVSDQRRSRSHRGTLSSADLELLRWSVSASYLGLRQSLGIRVVDRASSRRVA